MKTRFDDPLFCQACFDNLPACPRHRAELEAQAARRSAALQRITASAKRAPFYPPNGCDLNFQHRIEAEVVK